MIHLLDTNVLSETMRRRPAAAIARPGWRAQPLRTLFTSAICQAEILAGLSIKPTVRRRAELEAMAQEMFSQDFDGRILAFDARAAGVYAELFALRRQSGRPIEIPDLIVAATARAHGATVVTRDTGGFEGCGLALLDPWEAA